MRSENTKEVDVTDVGDQALENFLTAPAVFGGTVFG